MSGQALKGSSRASLSIALLVVTSLAALVWSSSIGAQSAGGGARHSAAVVSATAWTWGYNGNGQLADGSTDAKPSPTPVSLSSVTAVAVGGYHTLLLTSGGQVYASGHNSYDQLGLGANPDPPGPFHTPRPVIGLSDVVAIAAGTYHSLALTSTGTVYAWGLNTDGQLGDGTTTTRDEPVAVMTGAVAIAAGSSHSLAVASDGQAWAWGDNSGKQLGDGTFTDRHTPILVSPLTDLVHVAAGDVHSLFLDDTGAVYGVGANGQGATGRQR